MSDALGLRPMEPADVAVFAEWLTRPHFARWFLQDSTVAAELAACRAAVDGSDPTVMVMAVLDGRPVGWAQWYRWWDSPSDAAAYGARPGEIGIDYGLGDPAVLGRGLGSRLVALLLEQVRVDQARTGGPSAGVLAAPAAANTASRAVLERNGFTLVGLRELAAEPNASPLACYRRAPS